MYYIASLSGGKDSLAMVLKLIELKWPLDYCIFYDGGVEFDAVYKTINKVKHIIEDYGAKLIVLKPDTDFFYNMLLKPVCEDTGKEHYGMDWCGGCVRWATMNKVNAIDKFLNSLDDEYIQYIGIAFDEAKRIKCEKNKVYPLVELQMTEQDCLSYCYKNGYTWEEGADNVRLYDLLDRVSCWCCANKNLKELRNIYHYLPKYWKKLKALQSRIPRPFYHDKTIFDLEERFKLEDLQGRFVIVGNELIY